MLATKQLQIANGILPTTSQRNNMIDLQLKSGFTSFAIVMEAALALSISPNNALH
jgi:hypothetical protein